MCWLEPSKSRRRRLVLGARIEGVAQTVSEQVESERRDENRQARPDDQPGLRQVVLWTVGEQAAPAGDGLLDPDAEEREAGLGENELRDGDRREDDDRSDEVRQQMRANDAPVTRAHQ